MRGNSICDIRLPIFPDMERQIQDKVIEISKEISQDEQTISGEPGSRKHPYAWK
jgi:hypothetical protein